MLQPYYPTSMVKKPSKIGVPMPKNTFFEIRPCKFSRIISNPNLIDSAVKNTSDKTIYKNIGLREANSRYNYNCEQNIVDKKLWTKN